MKQEEVMKTEEYELLRGDDSADWSNDLGWLLSNFCPHISTEMESCAIVL